jgi:GAF domain-containing protein
MMQDNDGPRAPGQTAGDHAPAAAADWQPGFARVALGGALFLGLLVLAPDVYFGLGPAATLALLGAYLAVGIVVLLRGSYNLLVASSVLILAAAGISASFAGSAPSNGTFFFLALILVATLLWSPAAGGIATISSLIVAAVGAALAMTAVLPPSQSPAGWIGVALAVLLFGLAAVFGVRYLQRSTTGTATLTPAPPPAAQVPAVLQASDVEVKALGKALEIGRTANAIRDLDELLNQIPRLLARAFALRRVELYTVNDQGDEAVLAGDSGPSGELLTSARQSVVLSGKGAIAQAIRTRETCRDLEGGETWAVPLCLGDRVLGALKLLPDGGASLEKTELEAIGVLAEQIAVALDNANAFKDMARKVPDSIAAASKSTAPAWNPLAQPSRLEYEVGGPETPGGGAEMSVPLSLRDETIGTISLAADTDWSEEQRNLVEAVATQAALALENARLVEASQLTAQREHLLAEITGKVWASPTIEGILRTAVQELGQALEVDSATVELKTESENGS